jgi:predicted XRE-type DNA-binding protein
MAKVKSAFASGTLPASDVAILEIKSRLMMKLTDIRDASGMTKAQAARRFGVPAARVTDLRNGNIDNFSVDMLIEMLVRTGRDVKVVVRRRA